MPLQNRVLPTGEIAVHPARGTMMGNRGILHDGDKCLGRARWRHKVWIACVLDFRGRHRTVMTPGRYTELFFLDEAVALAAGHRPCGECRRGRYRAFMDLWEKVCSDLGAATPKDIDRALHEARIDRATGTQRRTKARLGNLPDGSFVLIEDTPLLIWKSRLWPYSPGGYSSPRTMSNGEVTLITPQPIVRLLRAGYRPDVHPSAQAAPSEFR